METPKALGGHSSTNTPHADLPPDVHTANPTGTSDSALSQPAPLPTTPVEHATNAVNPDLVQPAAHTIQPTSAFRQELKDHPVDATHASGNAHTMRPHVGTSAAVIPSAPEMVSPVASDTTSVSTPAYVDPMIEPVGTQQASGRWQVFWYALSVLSLGALFIAVSIVTNAGTLEKLLYGLKPNPDEVLFGARASIVIANSLLGSFLVNLPVFIYATIKVDRFKSAHSAMPTAQLKRISYIFMVLAVLTLTAQLGSAIFQALNYTFSVVNIVPLIVDVVLVMTYFFWLYTSVAEDRWS